MEVYNKNRDKNNGMHDEIREQNAKLKDAPLKEKMSYFKDYYLKTTLIAICILIFIISVIHSIVSGPSDTVFAAYFFNDSGDSSDTSLAENFAAYMGIDTKEHEVYIDATLSYNDGEASDNAVAASGYDVYVDLQKTMAIIAAKDLDVLVCDDAALAYFSKADCLADVRDVLSAEQLEKYHDLLYYYHNDDTNEDIPVGVYVQDAPKIAERYYYVNKDAVLSFIVNSEDLDNAAAFLDYIYLSE